MGTDFEIWLVADSSPAGELFEFAFAEIDRIDASLSSYRATSEISRINRQAPVEPVTTDPETFGILRRSLEYSARTAGAFDITVGQLMRAWGFFRDQGRYPTDAELERARKRTGWEQVELDPGRRTVRFRRSGILLDLGASGKGYALDRVAALLRASGVDAVLLGAGQSTYVAVGSPPGAMAWRVNVPDPNDRSLTASSIGLCDAALSTSGSYEKFFAIGGKTYCHIVDPRTGRPVTGMLQATARVCSGEESDMLATAAFVTGTAGAADLIDEGPDRGLMLVTGDPANPEVGGLSWPDTAVAELRQEARGDD